MLKQIKTDKLMVSENNVRKSSLDGLSDLAENIKEMMTRFGDGDGLIHPLTVVADESNKSFFKVISGQRRLLAINLLNEAEPGFIKKVKCLVVDAGDGDQALLSLSENSFTAQMDAVDRFAAYSALVAKGNSIANIARSFGTTANKVNQALAIDKLDDGVIAAWKSGEFDERVLYRLTTYSIKDQKRVIAAIENKEGEFYHAGSVDNYLKRSAIDISHALFDVKKSKLAVITDLFEEEQFVEDVDAFLDLQREAIKSLIKDSEKQGIECMFYDIDHGYPWVNGGESIDDILDLNGDHSNVYNIYSLHEDGRVRSYLRRFSDDESKIIYDLKVGAGLIEPEPVEDGGAPHEPEKPVGRQELTAKDQEYFRNWQHLFVCDKLADDVDYSHRLMLTMLIMDHGIRNSDKYDSAWENLKFDDPQYVKSAMKVKIDELIQKYHGLIRRKPKYGEARSKDFALVFKTVLSFNDVQIKELMTVIAILGIRPNSGILNFLGSDLSIDVAGKWKPDAGFTSALSSNPALIGVATDVIENKEELAAFESLKVKDKKAKLAELIGDNYKPKYFEFPAQRYNDIKLDIQTNLL